MSARLLLSRWVIFAFGVVVGLAGLQSSAHADEDDPATDLQATGTPPDSRVAGTVTGFGDAVDAGPATTNAVLGAVGIAATTTGNGYWLAASDGGIFSFGDATYLGSMGAVTLNAPVVGIAATPTGNGYWLTASDGGIFAFGDATYLGSMGAVQLPSTVTSIAADPGGQGYWLGLQSGQILAFGTTDYGSPAELAGSQSVPLTSIVATAEGYLVVYGDETTLQITSRGPQVLAMQYRLVELGYWLGPLDGIYGQLTSQAVMAFEKVERLEADGEADPEMLDRLQEARRPTPRSTSGDLVEIDAEHQVMFVVRSGRVSWVLNVSTGTEQPYVHEGTTRFAHTPRGRYTMNRQIDDWRVSYLGRLYRPKYVVGGIAIHGSSLVPNYPASHGCIRVSLAAMDLLWGHGVIDLGSRIWVYGDNWRQ